MENVDTKHQYHLYFALKDRTLKHISEVENGLKCNCICPACEKKLVARNAGQKRVHHFAHYKSPECKYGVQSSIHLAAKDILLRIKKIKIPSIAIFCNTEIEKGELAYISHGEHVELSSEKYIPIDNVILEKKLHKYIPDVIVFSKEKKLIIEIAVTHFVGRKKLDKIKESNISALEINLSNLGNNFKLEDLETLIVENVENKEWLNNCFANEQRRKKQEYIIKKINAENKETQAQERELWYRNYYKNVTTRIISNNRKVLQIENCPLRKREFKGQYYANIKSDCFMCENSRGLRNDNKYLICLFNYKPYKKYNST
jgi:hypothetical protein